MQPCLIAFAKVIRVIKLIAMRFPQKRPFVESHLKYLRRIPAWRQLCATPLNLATTSRWYRRDGEERTTTGDSVIRIDLNLINWGSEDGSTFTHRVFSKEGPNNFYFCRIILP